MYNAFLTNYSDVEFVLDLDFELGIELLNKLTQDKIDKAKDEVKQLQEQRIWEQWIVLYPFMIRNELKTEDYTTFRDRLLKNIDNPEKELTESEIWDDVESILDEFKVQN